MGGLPDYFTREEHFGIRTVEDVIADSYQQNLFRDPWTKKFSPQSAGTDHQLCAMSIAQSCKPSRLAPPSPWEANYASDQLLKRFQAKLFVNTPASLSV